MYEIINFIRDNRRAVLAIGLIVMVVLAFSGFDFVKNQISPANVELIGAPKGTKFKIKNKIYSEGKITLDPGTYKIKAFRDDFYSLSQEVKVTKDFKVVTFALQPRNKDGESVVGGSYDVYRDVEKKGGEEVVAESERLRLNNPIISVLPYEGILYNITYRLEERYSSKVVVTIDAKTSEDRAFALQRIRDWGYNPVDYKIEFTNFVNPLGRSSDAQ